jgi:hypothetical protein
MNQALFERILISDDGDITGELRAPFGLLFQAVGHPASEDGLTRLVLKALERPRGPEGPLGLNNDQLVELSGLEPLTSWVRSRSSTHAPSCATPENVALRSTFEGVIGMVPRG